MLRCEKSIESQQMESLVQKVTKHQQLFYNTKALEEETANICYDLKKEKEKGDYVYNNSLNGIFFFWISVLVQKC